MSNLVTITSANFDGIIAKHDMVVIDFWAQWCQPCLAFAPVFEQVANDYPDVLFGKVNTEEEQQLARDFAIRSIPTLMVFRQKVLLLNESGMLPAVALKDLIEQAKALDMKAVLSQLGEEK